MLANKMMFNTLLRKNPISVAQVATYATGGFHNERLAIGNREWVGYGINSTPNYMDRIDYPFPAVRFQEITGDLIPLKEKEKGDWKMLTIDEKKKLYRNSFRLTFAEINAPTGKWKSIAGWTFFLTSIGIWLFIIDKLFLYEKNPRTLSDEWRAHQLRRMLDLKMGHLSGVSSKWDYEKDDWKK